MSMKGPHAAVSWRPEHQNHFFNYLLGISKSATCTKALHTAETLEWFRTARYYPVRTVNAEESCLT